MQSFPPVLWGSSVLVLRTQCGSLLSSEQVQRLARSSTARETWASYYLQYTDLTRANSNDFCHNALTNCSLSWIVRWNEWNCEYFCVYAIKETYQRSEPSSLGHPQPLIRIHRERCAHLAVFPLSCPLWYFFTNTDFARTPLPETDKSSRFHTCEVQAFTVTSTVNHACRPFSASESTKRGTQTEIFLNVTFQLSAAWVRSNYGAFLCCRNTRRDGMRFIYYTPGHISSNYKTSGMIWCCKWRRKKRVTGVH